MKIIVASNKIWDLAHFEYLKNLDIIKQLKLVRNTRELGDLIKSGFIPSYIFFTHWSDYIKTNIYNEYKCILFHMTDLPYGRGGSPLQNLILNGHKQTKISAITVTKDLDAGDVYLKYPLELVGSAQEIYERTSRIIHTIMIPKILKENIIPVSQEGTVTKFNRRNQKQSEITEEVTSISDLYNFIRMLDADGYPRAFIKHAEFVFEFINAKLIDNEIQCDVRIMEAKNE